MSSSEAHSVAEHDPIDDGSATTTAAIQAAIDAAADAGGGIAHVPPGEYVTGTLELKDGVTLHVEAGATLLGSTDRDDYADDELTGDFFWDIEGREGWHDARAPLVVADDASEIALTGGGRIDARGENFWTVDKERTRFVPDDRPGMMIRFTRCTGVRVRDVHIENSPGWTLHIRGCEDVSVHNARINNSAYGPNTDGIDVDACRNVRISDCEVMAGGDDGIVLKNVLKGLREYPDEPSRNITVTNCDLASTTNPFKIGTENYGGFEEVALSNSVLRAPVADVDYEVDERFGEATKPHSGAALEMVDGATLDGLAMSNVVMRDVGAPIFLRVGNRPRYREGNYEPGSVRNVSISDVVATGARFPSPIAGLPDGPIENVSVSNVRIETAGGETDPDVAEREIPEAAEDYPEATQWGTLPAAGFYCRHVEGLTLENVSLTVADEDVRPRLDFDDVTDLRIDGLAGDAPAGDQSLVRLTGVRRALVEGVIAPDAADTVVGIEGESTRRITVTGCDLSGVDKPVRTGGDVHGDAIELIGNRR